MIERLDRNGNGSIDPDEMEGPASFMIQRMQRDDPSIRTDRPIPISKIKEAFERMRGGGGGGGPSDGRGEEGGDLSAALSAAELVPGFGGLELPPPVPGFGAAAELMAVRVTDADIRDAEETLQRYDRNRNRMIDSDELSGRWEGNPLDFDQNRDNKLSVNELAVRNARRRVARTEMQAKKAVASRPKEKPSEAVEIKDRFEGRLSYRPQASTTSIEGLPGWFTDKDADKDNQVRMSEYASEWTDEVVEEFYGYDLNFDGVITSAEALDVVKNGPSGSRTMASTTSGTSSSSSTSGAPGPAVPVGEISEKYMKYAERIVKRADKNGDNALTVDEWKDMLIDVKPADANRDGRVTIEEYAAWSQAKSGTNK
jgi:Ca2+-binding EF-hand superfamily protein